MPLDIIVGTQWGDEGIGQIGTHLAHQADYVARFNGGDNAGHSISLGKQRFKLNLVPSGVIRPQTSAVLGNGLVINPKVLVNEIATLRSAGIEITPARLHISHAAHIVTPAYLALDKARERARGDDNIFPLRGIGPAYNHKAARSGLRMEDMLSVEHFAKEILAQIEAANDVLVELYETEPLNTQDATQEYADYAYQLAPYITNVSALLSDAITGGANILAEGVQGTLMDLDHGVYPFVGNSTTTASGALTGLGLGAGSTHRVIGVCKAYQSHPGDGAFPTEIFEDKLIQQRGNGKNAGSQSEAPSRSARRFGWLDGVLLRYAIQINGITELAITQLSALSRPETLRICTAYRAEDQIYRDLPLGPTNIDFEPIYEEFPGWQGEILRARKWRQLPKEAQRFIKFIENLAGVPVRLVSIGPEGDQIIEVK
jgi:adenylosuccinate synthase